MFWWKLREIWSPVQSKEVPWVVCQKCTQPRPSVILLLGFCAWIWWEVRVPCSSSSCHPASHAEGKVTMLRMLLGPPLSVVVQLKTTGRAIPGCSDMNKNNPTQDVAVGARAQQPHVRLCHLLHSVQDFIFLPGQDFVFPHVSVISK